MVACIVELEQKCGNEKCKVAKMEDKIQKFDTAYIKFNNTIATLQKKIDDFEDALSYDKEYIVKLETEVSNLKQAKIRLKREKLRDRL